jgi:hypothetical protein
MLIRPRKLDSATQHDLQADDLGKICYQHAVGMMTAREDR